MEDQTFHDQIYSLNSIAYITVTHSLTKQNIFENKVILIG